MSFGVFFKGDLLAVLLCQPGVYDRNRWIHGQRMPGVIRRVVCQCPNRESIFIHVLGLAKKGHDEVAAADIMRQVAEEPASKRVIPHILDNAASVSIGMRLLQLGGGRRGISPKEK